MKISHVLAIALVLEAITVVSCRNMPKELERPERIVSIREVMYDSATYAKLAQLWKDYYDAYPSEDAYANWMYATRYVLSDTYGKKREEYLSMLEEGVKQYPSNPTLLYLLGNEKQNKLEKVQLFEKSTSFDPTYMDPWYSLVVTYLSLGERQKADVALRSLIDGGAVADEVMDFCYNMIASLDTNAILITNGDNDTFPAWILTRIVKFRPDVSVVNRALLNTDWYASSVMKEGVPQFIKQASIDSLRNEVSARMTEARRKNLPYREVAPFGDMLISRIIEAAQTADRPVYFACTLGQMNTLLESCLSKGRQLGLVTMVTPSAKTYRTQLAELFRRWTDDFRTAGLDSWELRYAKDSRSGRMLVENYATALISLKQQIETASPDVQLALFRWYRNHVIGDIRQDTAHKVDEMWCSEMAPREIREWCRRQGLSR